VAAAYAALPGAFERGEVVGCARIGRQRVVKLRFQAGRSQVLLQERWIPTAAGWRVAAVEITRAEPAS
jgi:hypothetical protein